MVDFRDDPELDAFRREVRAFLADALTSDAVAEHRDPTDLTGLDETYERELQRRAGQRGWLTLPPERQAIFDYEVARADAPLIDTAMTLAGHVVAAYGSEQQRARFLTAMGAGELEVCIAYTEADAGSDLSGIRTTARADSDDWILDGTKVLVTGAHKADWCCTLARTRLDWPPRQGMSMFLVDMRAPGVEVVRRPTMNGWTLDDVHFRHVRVGSGGLLGERDRGWAQLASAVATERSGVFWLGFARHVLDLLVDHVRSGARGGAVLVDDPIARDAVARLTLELEAAERLARRAQWAQRTGDDDPPRVALGAMCKVVATELLQQIAQVAVDLAGHAGLAWAPPFSDAPPGAAGGGRFAWEYLERVHGTIGAGANEIHRDAIAQHGLGLPRSNR
jgi:alkylation response protein AidB-like acyl-CoA dehydrogenase